MYVHSKLSQSPRNRPDTDSSCAAPRKPIKKLPTEIELPADATVEDAKISIAKATGIRDYNRIGIFDPSTKKTLKNRHARIAEEPAVVSGGEVLVKDLGTSQLPAMLPM